MAIRLFFDSSALFAAVYSSTGAARELIHLSILGHVQIVMSQDVLEESIRNLQKKAPRKVSTYKQLLLLLNAVVIESPSLDEVREAEALVVKKDSMILAAVRKADVSFFVTLDKKHLLGNPSLEAFVGKKIGTPQEALAFVQEQAGSDGQS